MAFAAARMILKDKRRKSKEEFSAPARNRSKVLSLIVYHNLINSIPVYLIYSNLLHIRNLLVMEAKYFSKIHEPKLLVALYGFKKRYLILLSELVMIIKIYLFDFVLIPENCAVQSTFTSIIE